MDGTLKEDIVNNTKVSAIAIDLWSQKIFWANDFESIQTSDYKGENCMMWTTISTNVLSLAIFDNKLFWLFSTHENSNSVIVACRIGKKNCEEHSVLPLPFRSTRIAALSYDHKIPRKNPCEKENGNCDHICLLSLEGGHTCACRVGWRLNSNSKSCVPVEDIFLYASNHFFYGKILINEEGPFIDALSPVRYPVEQLKYRDTIDFDRSWNPWEIFYCDDKNIYVLNLIHGNYSRVLRLEAEYYIKDLYIDLFTKVLLYDVSNIISSKVIMKASTVHDQRIFHKSFNIPNNHPSFISRSFYYKVLRYYKARAEFSDIGNTECFESFIKTYNSSVYKTLAFDYNDFTIYGVKQRFIYYCSIVGDGSIKEFRLFKEIKNPKHLHIYIYEQWLFIGTDSGVYRMNKKTGQNVMNIDGRYAIDIDKYTHYFQVFNAKTYSVPGIDTPCLNNNGGCEQFCIHVGKLEKLCSCDDSFSEKKGECFKIR